VAAANLPWIPQTRWAGSARETSPLAQRMQDIIDIDTGAVISGGSTIEEMGDALLERLVEVASGQLRTKAELLGQDDFIP
jgi:altronate hydrolase